MCGVSGVCDCEKEKDMNWCNSMGIAFVISCIVISVGIVVLGDYIMPISDDGCKHYQDLRSRFTSEGVAIGCEWNGTAWHFNQTRLRLEFNATEGYLI